MKYTLLATAACLALLAAPATANPMREVALADEELEQQRGGFLLAGGLVIDFSFYQQTVINGELQHELQLSTAELMQNLGSQQDLRTLIQVGEGNINLGELAEIPGISTIITNTLDNTMIQNLSNLDISVGNLAAVRHDINSQLETQLISGLH